jgi:predicted O-methyltransferase YrrM
MSKSRRLLDEAKPLAATLGRFVHGKGGARRHGGTSSQDTPSRFPPGHFYSPIPNLSEVRAREASIFGNPDSLGGIELGEERQLELLRRFAELYPSVPFPERPTQGARYHYENDFYSYSDAITLHCMMRTVMPKRIIEVGSGFTSAAILDTVDRFFPDGLALTSIDPYPKRLHSLLRDEDRVATRIIETQVQDVDPKVFCALEAGDILLVDSSHVSKAGSDVHFLLFEVLPRLRDGALIHFHDVFYPFEYPKDWIYQGWTFHEAYLLRAFLQNNSRFRIKYFQSMMFRRHRAFFEERMPLCLRNSGGNIWIEKTG